MVAFGKRAFCSGCSMFLVLVAAGCTQSPAAPESQSSAQAVSSVGPTAGASSLVLSATVEKNRQQWTLPTDPYFDYDGPYNAHESEAYGLVRSACMEKAGYDDPVRTDPSAPRAETTGTGGSILFDADLAAKYGYRLAPNPQDLLEDEIAARDGEFFAEYSDRSQPESKEFWDSFYSCNEAAMAEINPGSTESAPNDSDSVDAGYNVLYGHDSVPELQQPARDWKECMAPLGIVDLPDMPWEPGELLPESLGTRLNWEPSVYPSAEESEVAVKDANCREESGWSEALYNWEWNVGQKFVDDHQDDLAPLLEQRNQNLKRFDSIVAKYQGGEG